MEAPLTGPLAYEGTGFQKTLSLLVDDTNAGGGIGGRKVELLVEDDRGEAGQAAVAAHRLVSRGVVAVIGSFGSTATEIGAAVYADAGVLHLTPSSTATALTQKGYGRFFRVCSSDERQGRFAAEFIDTELGHSRVALVYESSTYGRGLAAATRDELELRGGTVVFSEAIDKGQTDFGAVLARLAATDAQSVYFAGYWEEAGLLLSQAPAAKVRVKWLLSEPSNNAGVVSIAGLENARGALITSEPRPADLQNAEAASFRAAFKARYGAEPESPYWATAADAYRLVARAIESTGSTDPARLAGYLHRDLRDLPVVTGTIAGFDETGERLDTAYLTYVIDATGAIVPYRR